MAQSQRRRFAVPLKPKGSRRAACESVQGRPPTLLEYVYRIVAAGLLVQAIVSSNFLAHPHVERICASDTDT